jgi:DNA-directed RNA polymerase subunit omega
LNAELLKKAADKIGNPNILVNLVSRRVRQLNATGGVSSRPLLMDTTSLGTADIALAELVEDKMGWEKIETLASESTGSKKRRRG